MLRTVFTTLPFVLICFAGVLSAGEPQTDEKQREIALLKSPAELIVCGDSLVQIVDVPHSKGGEPAIVWEWNAQEAEDLPAEYRTNYFRAIDDCKPAEGGTKILVTSSSGGVVVIDRGSKRVLFRTVVPMAHSVELLPHGHIAVAGSTHPQGNCLAIYSLQTPDAPVINLELYSGHGVVFFDKTSDLYALGYADLRRYQVTFDDQQQIALELKNTWKIPGESGHDLAYDPREKDLLVTEHTSVWRFDMASHQFTEFAPLLGREDVKSVSVHAPTGTFAYVQAEEQWWSPRVRFLDTHFDLKFPGRRLYKARWVK